MAAPLRTYEEAIAGASAVASAVFTRLARSTDEEVVEAAYAAYGPSGPSREELLATIRALRIPAHQQAA